MRYAMLQAKKRSLEQQEKNRILEVYNSAAICIQAVVRMKFGMKKADAQRQEMQNEMERLSQWMVKYKMEDLIQKTVIVNKKPKPNPYPNPN